MAWVVDRDRDATTVTAIRPAVIGDLDSFVSFDHIAQRSEERVAYLRAGIERESCIVAERGAEVKGLLILDRFFSYDFIGLVYVAADVRRTGVASELIAHAESACASDRLFTSTNLSNKPMQSLLEGRGYVLSGYVDNLDEGDPELIYVRKGDGGAG